MVGWSKAATAIVAAGVFCQAAAGQPSEGRSEPATHVAKPAVPSREEVRRQVSAGEVRFGTCITDTLESHENRQAIVFRNSCDVKVNVELCERRSEDVSPSHYFIVIAPRSESRFRPWLKAGETFHYTYNSCGAQFCTPPDSDC
jgi:hypothetical protein